jgi:hypothetical protein
MDFCHLELELSGCSKEVAALHSETTMHNLDCTSYKKNASPHTEAWLKASSEVCCVLTTIIRSHQPVIKHEAVTEDLSKYHNYSPIDSVAIEGSRTSAWSLDHAPLRGKATGTECFESSV